jgi:hypothetical protein
MIPEVTQPPELDPIAVQAIALLAEISDEVGQVTIPEDGKISTENVVEALHDIQDRAIALMSELQRDQIAYVEVTGAPDDAG